MIPSELEGFETYIVSYSGGKDSTATALWALENLPREKLRFVFCDTGAQWPENLPYLKYVEGKLGVEIDRIRAGDRERPNTCDYSVFIDKTNLFDMVRARGKFPGAKYRYCTQYLKRWPLVLYAREYASPLVLSGSRREESARRSQYPAFDPTGDKTGVPRFRPILDWSEDDVWQYLADRDILPNPTYNYASRANCWCCPMARPQELFNFCRKYPEEARRWADLEIEIGHPWHENLSIGNILARAEAQLALFKQPLRFG